MKLKITFFFILTIVASSQCSFAAYSLGKRESVRATAIFTSVGTIVFQTPKFYIMGSRTVNAGKDMSYPFPKYNSITKDLDVTVVDPEQVADVNISSQSIRWDSREIHLQDEVIGSVFYPKTKWLRAKTYVEIDVTITDGNGGIQIYTDNTNASGDFMENSADYYQGNYDPNVGSIIDPVGLYPTKLIVQPDGTAAKRNGAPLALAWRVVSSNATNTVLGITQGATVNGSVFPSRLWVNNVTYFYEFNPDSPNNVPTIVVKNITGLGATFPYFVYMKDLRSPDNIRRALNIAENSDPTTVQINGLAANVLRGALTDYSKIRHADYGIQHAENTWAAGPSKSYIFFAADFTNAVGANPDSTGNPISGTERTYKANIIIEAFTE